MNLKDRINNMPALEAVRGAWVAIDRLQVERHEVMVMGAATLFRELCVGTGLDIAEVLNKVERMSKAGDINREVSALRDYIRKEIR